MKILFSSVGRRVELVQAFRNAAEKLHQNLMIVGADITDTAPALQFCDETVLVPRIKDDRYIPFLIEYCRENDIDALVPTIDTDLLLLAENRERFGKTKVLISAPDKIKLCRDKRLTAEYFQSLGLHSPHPVDDYTKYDDAYPAFIKPKDGSSSIFAYQVNNEAELKEFAARVPDYIVQPFIEGTEYTVDIFCDFDGNPIFITPRIRMAVRAGEVLKTQIDQDATIISEMKALVKDFKPCGQITVQLIREKHSGTNCYIEINPRFGGGAPLSIKAGADSAEMLIRLLNGEKIEYREKAAEDGARYSRFDQSVRVSNGDGTQPIRGVIYDLDDTLYSEKQYVRSGYQKIAEHLGRPDAAEKLWGYFEAGKPAIDAYLTEIGQEDIKAECLKVYREQTPDITLYAGVAELITSLRSRGIKVGIITDGRPEGQRNKLKALGLEALVDDIIITDELGGVQFRKPCDIAFRMMQIRWNLPYEQMVYVGDNPEKDFQACRKLGMQWRYFRNEDGLYSGQNFDTPNQLRSITEFPGDSCV